MRIITGVGYYATGSSVIQDFCHEFSSCEVLAEYEIRFLQDPDGVSDLQYYLVDNNHRHNTGFEMKRFIKYTNFLNGSIYTKRYRKYFGDAFKRLTDEYVSALSKLTAQTWWHRDQLEKGRLFFFIDLLYSKITGKFRKICSRSLLKGHEVNYYTYLTRDEFLKITRHYTGQLFEAARKTDRPYLIVDQLVSPSNIDRYTAYFDDIKTVIVDRDPRDLYIAAREFFKEGIIPVSDVEEFCTWYQVTREHRKHELYNREKTLFVRFEDLVYKYDETTGSVMCFLGINEKDHVDKKKYFNPERSVKGTRLFNRFPQYAEDISYMEEKLTEYLYPFENA